MWSSSSRTVQTQNITENLFRLRNAASAATAAVARSEARSDAAVPHCCVGFGESFLAVVSVIHASVVGEKREREQMSASSNARATAAPAAVDLFSKRDFLRNTGGAQQGAGYEFQATTGLSESLKHQRNFHSAVGSTGLQTDDASKKDWGSTVIWRNDVKSSDREAAEVRTLTKHDLQRGAKDFKPNSTVVAAVAQSKKTRHFEVLDEYDRCLNLIVDELSKATLACVRTVKQRLTNSKLDVQKLFDCMADQFLTQLSQTQVEKVWSDFADILAQRDQCIRSFAADAEGIEVARSQKVSAELQHVTDLLLDISYQNAGVVERLVEDRAASLNLVLIDNRRSHADAVAKLRVHEIEYERMWREHWEKRREAWYQTLHDRAVSACAASLNSVEYTAPDKRKTLFSSLRSQQKALFDRRCRLTRQILSLLPPNLTVDGAAAWKGSMVELDKEQEKEHKQRCGSLRVFERELKARGLAEVQALRKELIESAKSTGHVLPTDEELEADCAPLNQLITERFDAQMKIIDSCAEVLQAQLNYYGDIAAKLVKLVIALADTADDYVKRCSSLHGAHKDNVDKVATVQAAANAQLEEQFAAVSKLIVQDATRAALDEHLPQALALLDQLLAGFRNYTTLCNDESSGYVSGAAEVAQWFQGAVCCRLGVEKKKVESRPVTAASDNGQSKTTERPKTGAKAGKGKEPEPAAVDAPPPEPEPVEDLNVVTIEGSGVYKVVIALEQLPGSMEGDAAPAAPEDAAASQVDPFVVPLDSQKSKLLEAFVMNQDLLDTVRSTLRRGLLQFCVQQCGILQAQVNDSAKDEKEQATIALDEYLRRHRPRAGHLEMHLYEVRDTQLQQHADKLSRLVLAFAQRAAQQQPVFKSGMKGMEERLQAYKLEQSKRVKDLDTASGSAALKTLTDAAARTQMQFLQELKKWKAKMATQADDARQALVSSSNSALQFMSTFESGGNYNPEELEASRSRLQVLVADAEKRQASWDAVVDEAVVKHSADAEQALKDFTDLVKNVARDLDMAESADKEARAAELARQMQSADNDRAMEVLGSKVERIEKLTAAHAAVSTSESATRPSGTALVTASVLEAVCVASVLMRELVSCRWRIRSRAKFLECLVTDMAPDKAVVTDDVLTDQWAFTSPPELTELERFNLLPGEGFSVAEEQQVEEKDWDQQPMSKAVAAAVEKQKAKLADLYKAYYAELAGRAITRPQRIPATAAESTEKTNKIMEGVLQGCARYQAKASAQLRGILMRLANAMISVPAAMFVDVQQRHSFQLQRCTLFLEDQYQVAETDLKKRRVENTAALKPSLSNPNAKAELDDLDSRETERNAGAKSKAIEHKQRVLSILNHAAQTYAGELNARWKSLTNIYDSLILIEHLQPSDEVIAMARQPLQSLLAEAARRAEGSSKIQPAAGQVFPPKSYKPMPASELTVAFVLGEAGDRPESAKRRAEEEAKKAEEAAKAAAAAKAAPAKGGKAPAAVPVAEVKSDNPDLPVASLDSAAHSVLYKMYSKYWRRFSKKFVEGVNVVSQRMDQVAAEETQWNLSWVKLTSALRN